MNRHRLAIRQKTRQGQKTPEDGARTLEEFSAKVKQVMAAEGITCVYNADQTATCYEYLPKKTSDSKGEQREVLHYKFTVCSLVKLIRVQESELCG